VGSSDRCLSNGMLNVTDDSRYKTRSCALIQAAISWKRLDVAQLWWHVKIKSMTAWITRSSTLKFTIGNAIVGLVRVRGNII
jgi:hypothetical protein